VTDRSRDVPCVVDKMMDILTKLVNKTSIFMDQSLDLMSKDDITGTAETTTASKSTADGTSQRPSTTNASLFFLLYPQKFILTFIIIIISSSSSLSFQLALLSPTAFVCQK